MKRKYKAFIEIDIQSDLNKLRTIHEITNVLDVASGPNGVYMIKRVSIAEADDILPVTYEEVDFNE